MALELELCRRDVVHWVNHWVWTYDPRESHSTIPFDLYPKQAEFLRWLEECETKQEDGLAEKSRDTGLTWLCCAYSSHRWRFRAGWLGGFGSRKLDLVDKIGDPACIFDKLRFIVYNLPEWMRPKGFKREAHDCYAKLINPENGSTITGEGGDNIGRGGRASMYFVDEAAFLERPASVERSLSQTTRCRIDVSTPNGPGNPFAAKRFSGRVKVFTFHWRDDPRKDEKWYAEQKAKFDPVTVAQEIDIDYTASVEGICIPAAWVRSAVEFDLPESGETVGGFDIAEEGIDLSVIIPRRGPVLKAPKAWQGELTTASAYKAIEYGGTTGIKRMNFDTIGVGVGVKSTFVMTDQVVPFEAIPVNVGESPRDDVLWPDGKTSKEKFINVRAELWWKMRVRFEKTFEHRTLGVYHPPEEMISIPNCPELIAELSQPLVEYTEMGKIQIESKKKMKARGVKSPNYADAAALSLYEPKRKKKVQVW
jgi:phage terminase large subunit